jgi:hypothetical protein
MPVELPLKKTLFELFSSIKVKIKSQNTFGTWSLRNRRKKALFLGLKNLLDCIWHLVLPLEKI